MTWLKSIFSIGAKELTDSIGNAFDKNFTTKEEKLQAKLEIEKVVNDHIEKIQGRALEELQIITEDKQNAREMYKTNSSLQKVYAITFLLAYVALAVSLIYIAVNHPSLPDYAQILVSTIFGGMSTKIGTITDFLFGSSLGSATKDMKKA
jgi:hypothetical protein